MTAVGHLQNLFKNQSILTIRQHLGGFGIHGDLALQKMSNLSGGQKSRVVFATITWKKPHVLLLDEPTNHLDLESIEALTDALINFKGGIVLVTHDQQLIERLANELWVVTRKGLVKRIDGTFDDYKKVIMRQKKKCVYAAQKKDSKCECTLKTHKYNALQRRR